MMTTKPRRVREPLAPRPKILNRYPTRIIAPDGTETTKVRAVITDDKAFFYKWDKEPKLINSFPITSYEATMRLVTLETDEGQWKVFNHGGCGCGDRLKNYLTSRLPGMS